MHKRLHVSEDSAADTVMGKFVRLPLQRVLLGEFLLWELCLGPKRLMLWASSQQPELQAQVPMGSVLCQP